MNEKNPTQFMLVPGVEPDGPGGRTSSSTSRTAASTSTPRRSSATAPSSSSSWCPRAPTPASTSWASTRCRFSTASARTKVGPGDLGGLYGAAAPKVNASKKPGEWQKFVIDFQAPRFEDGKKIANAKFVKVTLNDQVIHENVEMKGPTPSGVTGKEAPTGPLMFQGDHGPVAFRNIRVTAK